jgi:hypothetical protein
MKILTLLLVLKTVSATERESAPDTPRPILITPHNLQSFLTDTSAVTFGQILFRADDVFSGDTAYNRFFSKLIEDAKLASVSKSLEFYSDNLHKLHHIWSHYMGIADSHAKKLISIATSKKDLTDTQAIRLEATYKSIYTLHAYLANWGPTIKSLYGQQLKKAQALGYSDPLMLSFFTQVKMDIILINLTKHLHILEQRIKKNQKRQGNKENYADEPTSVKIPRLNLYALRENEINHKEPKIKSPRQFTPRKLIKSLSDRLLGNSSKNEADLEHPPSSWDRNTIKRGRSADEVEKRFGKM